MGRQGEGHLHGTVTCSPCLVKSPSQCGQENPFLTIREAAFLVAWSLGLILARGRHTARCVWYRRPARVNVSRQWGQGNFFSSFFCGGVGRRGVPSGADDAPGMAAGVGVADGSPPRALSMAQAHMATHNRDQAEHTLWSVLQSFVCAKLGRACVCCVDMQTKEWFQKQQGAHIA